MRAQRPEPAPLHTAFDRFPTQLGDWRGLPSTPLDDDVLAVLGVDDYVSRGYVAPDRSAVGLYIGYYGSQRQGDTMHSPLNCLPGAGWEPIAKDTLTINAPVVASGVEQPVVVNRYVVEKGLDRQLVLYWYQSHGRVVASEYWSKFYLIRDAVRLNRTDGAMVRVIAPIGGDEAAAERVAVRFVKQLFPSLGPFLPV
jgi:EpsI family protein